MVDGVDQVLRDNGVQVTAQRLAIMRAVAAMPHSTADQLADEVRSVIGTISRQAVYDTLGVFVEKGLLRRIQPAGSAVRYEDRVGDNHHHLICRDCTAVLDIDCAVGSQPCLTTADDHGFEIDEAEVIHWGTCPSCRAADGTRRGESAPTKTAEPAPSNRPPLAGNVRPLSDRAIDQSPTESPTESPTRRKQ